MMVVKMDNVSGATQAAKRAGATVATSVGVLVDLRDDLPEPCLELTRDTVSVDVTAVMLVVSLAGSWDVQQAGWMAATSVFYSVFLTGVMSAVSSADYLDGYLAVWMAAMSVFYLVEWTAVTSAV